MVCSYKCHSSWILQEKPRIRNLVKNNLIFGCIFFLLARGAVGVLFSTFWRNIYCFLMVVTGSKCLADIGNGCIKNLRPLMRFHLGAFLAWMRLPFFSCSLVVSSNFLCIGSLCALNVPKSSYMFVNSLSVINWSPKKAMSGFERWNFVPYSEIY